MTGTPELDLRKITDPIERARRSAMRLGEPGRDHGVLRRIQQEAVKEACKRKGWTPAKVAHGLGVNGEELERLAVAPCERRRSRTRAWRHAELRARRADVRRF